MITKLNSHTHAVVENLSENFEQRTRKRRRTRGKTTPTTTTTQAATTRRRRSEQSGLGVCSLHRTPITALVNCYRARSGTGSTMLPETIKVQYLQDKLYRAYCTLIVKDRICAYLALLTLMRSESSGLGSAHRTVAQLHP
ncbi:hypothetical protein ElyMa_001598300 [Elysia marginata]|uniref:Uncharacterized protein n=1 Tax=Elysia marginata TaxID=1093978 RepID=A0AAV4JH85_9GAST|nr:hypothetical protein ElyMa_001598300 [Elysia marginata]